MHNSPQHNLNNEAIDELTRQLEEEFRKENTGKTIDLNNTDENRSTEILELETNINELQKTLLPEQDINPDNELSSGKEKEIKKLRNGEIKEKKKKEKEIEKLRKEELRENKKIKKQEKIELKEKKQQDKKIKQAEKVLQKEIRKKEKEKIKQEIRNKKIEIREEKLKRKQEKKKKFEEQRIIFEQTKKENRQKKENKTVKNLQEKLKFAWYLDVIQRVVIYLVAVEILIYVFSLISILNLFLLNIILLLVLVLDVIVFAWLAVRVRYKYEKNYWTAVRTCVLAGLLVGLLRAIFKFFWVNEPWTIVNIFVEPFMTIAFALVTSLVIGIFIKKKINL